MLNEQNYLLIFLLVLEIFFIYVPIQQLKKQDKNLKMKKETIDSLVGKFSKWELSLTATGINKNAAKIFGGL
jgi:hypothetical protein